MCLKIIATLNDQSYSIISNITKFPYSDQILAEIDSSNLHLKNYILIR